MSMQCIPFACTKYSNAIVSLMFVYLAAYLAFPLPTTANFCHFHIFFITFVNNIDRSTLKQTGYVLTFFKHHSIEYVTINLVRPPFEMPAHAGCRHYASSSTDLCMWHSPSLSSPCKYVCVILQ
jgi:hypothetical protein